VLELVTFRLSAGCEETPPASAVAALSPTVNPITAAAAGILAHRDLSDSQIRNPIHPPSSGTSAACPVAGTTPGYDAGLAEPDDRQGHFSPPLPWVGSAGPSGHMTALLLSFLRSTSFPPMVVPFENCFYRSVGGTASSYIRTRQPYAPRAL
jgi:hypothetical protein